MPRYDFLNGTHLIIEDPTNNFQWTAGGTYNINVTVVYRNDGDTYSSFVLYPYDPGDPKILFDNNDESQSGAIEGVTMDTSSVSLVSSNNPDEDYPNRDYILPWGSFAFVNTGEGVWQYNWTVDVVVEIGVPAGEYYIKLVEENETWEDWGFLGDGDVAVIGAFEPPLPSGVTLDGETF